MNMLLDIYLFGFFFAMAIYSFSMIFKKQFISWKTIVSIVLLSLVWFISFGILIYQYFTVDWSKENL